MAGRYDLAVIGTGVAATATATRVRAAGWSVAVIDYHPFGGTCVLRGCDPKKVLAGAASALDRVRRMQGKGIAGDTHIDWPALMAFKRTFTDPVPEQRERSFAEQGITGYHGRARFTGRNTLEVNGEAIEARHILIACGAEPVKLGVPGEEYLATNEDFLALAALPRRIVLAGGGYIAAEFSHVAARCGAQVTIIQHGDRMLTRFDPELVDWLDASFRSAGIDVRTGASVQAIEKNGSAYAVQVAREGGTDSVEADLVVHAAGRKPDFDALDLEAGGVAVEKGRLRLNDYLQSTSNPAVYAAGDAAQMGPPLTPVSSHDAKVVAANLLEGNHHRPDYRAVPSVAFTIPPIAAVGMSEHEARNKGIPFRMKRQKASNWFTARQAAQPVYGFKVLVEESSGKLLGAHLVGPHADEVINLFALAIRHDLRAEDLKEMMFAYPTGASDIGYML
ncbi:dihydrolipoyl dehydrogenase family protein [Noviherbaspirillum massiliense]|uniref:dihydrolipoyl dehydrogenase family protein n=1 Tax=Noviherbaspirillum massiliense TaxID=1465823 RepID=UPI0003816BE9|nr:NAD(P)/FAD-dependent oxidoreductase [Noviherbaspirillum massiliense]